MFNIRPFWKKPKNEQVTPTGPVVPKNNWFRVGDTIYVVSYKKLKNDRTYDLSNESWVHFYQCALEYGFTAPPEWCTDRDFFYRNMAPSGRFLTVVKELPNRAWVKKLFGSTRVYIVSDGMLNFWVSADQALISDLKCREIWT